MIKNKRRVIIVALICILLLSTQSIGFAASQKFKKNLEAWYNSVTIVVNGREMSSQVQPFVANGTTYVPLRTMANIFDKNIQWDGTNNKAIITDKPNNNVASLKNQIIIKNLEISELKNEISKLKSELEDAEGMDIDDLEDQLSGDYDEYKDAEFDISISGDEDDITVEIEIDLEDYKDEWDDLDKDDIEDYLQDIVDDILDEYEDADIEGTIVDSDSDDELVEFDIDRDDDVDLSRFSASIDLDDYEDDLKDDYHDYFDDIELSIKLDGDKDDIEFTVYLDYDDYDDEWDNLSSGDIEEFMENIYDDIRDEYEDADIDGYIYDDDNNKYIYEY